MLYRLFIALELNEEMKDALGFAAGNLRAQSKGGAFTRRENLHVTLAFIGETPRVKDALKVTRETVFSPFELSLGEISFFENKNKKGDGKVYYVSVTGGGLFLLQSDIAHRLNQAGFALKDQPFVPHITLGRRVLPQNRGLFAVKAACMTASRVSLMKSERIGGILRYTKLCQSIPPGK